MSSHSSTADVRLKLEVSGPETAVYLLDAHGERQSGIALGLAFRIPVGASDGSRTPRQPALALPFIEARYSVGNLLREVARVKE